VASCRNHFWRGQLLHMRRPGLAWLHARPGRGVPCSAGRT